MRRSKEFELLSMYKYMSTFDTCECSTVELNDNKADLNVAYKSHLAK
jgi:hypothetical protein